MTSAVQVAAVSETLFLPLYALALESQRDDAILSDPGAVALTVSSARRSPGQAFDCTSGSPPASCPARWSRP